jgi:hypothetical protein
MFRQPITRLEWWLDVLILLAALAIHALSVTRATKKIIEAALEPKYRPLAGALVPPPHSDSK